MDTLPLAAYPCTEWNQGGETATAAFEAALSQISRTLLAIQLERLEEPEQPIREVEAWGVVQLVPHQSQIGWLMKVLGLSLTTVSTVLAELGVDRRMCQRNNTSRLGLASRQEAGRVRATG